MEQAERTGRTEGSWVSLFLFVFVLRGLLLLLLFFFSFLLFFLFVANWLYFFARCCIAHRRSRCLTKRAREPSAHRS